MITAFYTGSAGAISQEQGMDVTANNLANVSSNGYKADKAAFSDLVTTSLRTQQNGVTRVMQGHGARLSKTDTVFEQGGFTQTGRAQDYALTRNDQFFAVRSADGTVRYTRDGNFQLSTRADGSFALSTTQGDLVLDGSGNPIIVRDAEAKQSVGVYSFANLGGLNKAGDNCYETTALSGTPTVVPNAEVKEGYLEGSTVNLAGEMTDMINTNRAFDLSANIIKMSDEVMQTVNNLR
jgi:flagellar basal-body rod protein FlgG